MRLPKFIRAFWPARRIQKAEKPRVLYLGPYFDMSEFERSDVARAKGIDNCVPFHAQDNIFHLVWEVLHDVRHALGKPLSVSSGYRCDALNQAVWGSIGSLHMQGQAADIYVVGMTTVDLVQALLEHVAEFDQIIGYAASNGGQVHVSFRCGNNRNEVLYSPRKGVYLETPSEDWEV